MFDYVKDPTSVETRQRTILFYYLRKKLNTELTCFDLALPEREKLQVSERLFANWNRNS